MGFDRKYGQVTTEHGDIPADEPVIVFRARDINLPGVLVRYLQLCSAQGSPERHLGLIRDTHQAIVEWQEAHQDQVKVPDSERSRTWMET